MHPFFRIEKYWRLIRKDMTVMAEQVEIRAIVMAPNDNVATALADLGAGEKVKAKCGREIFETEIRNKKSIAQSYPK